MFTKNLQSFRNVAKEINSKMSKHEAQFIFNYCRSSASLNGEG